MKNLRFISFAFMILGAVLFLAGVSFRILHRLDMFRGIISGLAVSGIGAVLFLISLTNRGSSSN